MIKKFLLLQIMTLIAACASPVATPAPGFHPQIHRVREGEDLESIARQYGLQPETLLYSNPDSLQDRATNVRPGMQLRIPPEDGAIYVWQQGDRLNLIADFFGVEMDAIVNHEVNNLSSSSISPDGELDIPAGTLLFIPGGRRPLVRPPWDTPYEVERRCAMWYPTWPARCMMLSVE